MLDYFNNKKNNLQHLKILEDGIIFTESLSVCGCLACF